MCEKNGLELGGDFMVSNSNGGREERREFRLFVLHRLLRYGLALSLFFFSLNWVRGLGYYHILQCWISFKIYFQNIINFL